MYALLLTIHIAAGFTALTAAAVAVLTPKGERAHVYAGRVFVLGMALVFLTALPMTLMKPNLFLLLVAIFSFYLALSGWLRARNRRGVPLAAEWIAAGAMVLAAFAMCVRGIVVLRAGDSMGTVLLVFGGIGGLLAARDLQSLRVHRYTGTTRIVAHLTRMMAGTIIPRRYRDAHQRGLARFIETGDGRLVGKTVELGALHRDGHEFPAEISVSATSRSGARVAFVAFVSDVSERHMAERLRGVQFAVTRPLANAATWAEAAPQVLQGICETMGWTIGEFWGVDREANVLRLEFGWARPTRELAAFEAASRELTFARGDGLVGRVWATGRATSIEDVAGDRDSPRTSAALSAGLPE